MFRKKWREKEKGIEKKEGIEKASVCCQKQCTEALLILCVNDDAVCFLLFEEVDGHAAAAPRKCIAFCFIAKVDFVAFDGSAGVCGYAVAITGDI